MSRSEMAGNRPADTADGTRHGPKGHVSRRPPGVLVRRILLHVVLATGALLMIVPFLWMASTAFKESSAAFDYPPSWIPSPASLENFREVWTIVPFAVALRFFKWR